MSEHVLMSEIKIITDGGRRRRWTGAEKRRIVEETLEDHASISIVARHNGVAPNLARIVGEGSCSKGGVSP